MKQLLVVPINQEVKVATSTAQAVIPAEVMNSLGEAQRKVAEVLADGQERSRKEIIEAAGVKQSNFGAAVKALRKQGVKVKQRSEGRESYYSVQAKRAASASRRRRTSRSSAPKTLPLPVLGATVKVVAEQIDLTADPAMVMLQVESGSKQYAAYLESVGVEVLDREFTVVSRQVEDAWCYLGLANGKGKQEVLISIGLH